MSSEDDARKFRALIRLIKQYRAQHPPSPFPQGSFAAMLSRCTEDYDVDMFCRVGDTVVFVECKSNLPVISSISRAATLPASTNITAPPAQACESFLRALLTRRHFEALVAPRLHDMMDSYRPAKQGGRHAYAAFVVLRTYFLIGKDLLWPVMQIVLRYWSSRGGVD